MAEAVALSNIFNVALLFSNSVRDRFMIFTVLLYTFTCSWINKLFVLKDIEPTKLRALVTVRDWLGLKLVILFE